MCDSAAIIAESSGAIIRNFGDRSRVFRFQFGVALESLLLGPAGQRVLLPLSSRVNSSSSSIHHQEGQHLSKQSKSSRPCGHVLHTAPDLYILVSYQPRKWEPDYVRASCEYLDHTDPAKGSGLSVYLSPFDAHIDAAMLSTTSGRQYHTIHAAEFDPRELIQDNGGKFHYFMHCGWGASDGKLVTRRKGCFVTLCGIETIDVPPEHSDAIDIKIDRKDLERYSRMRESAGLFAHAECHSRVRSLSERERMQHVACAIDSVPGTVPVTAEINQMAMYDFDASQWHFVPIDVFRTNTDDNEAK